MRRIKTRKQITLIRRATGEVVEAADVEGVAVMATTLDTDGGTASIKGQVGHLARVLQSTSF